MRICNWWSRMIITETLLFSHRRIERYTDADYYLPRRFVTRKTKEFSLFWYGFVKQCITREVEVQAEEEQTFLAKQQAALLGLKDPTRSPTTRNQASTGPVIQVIPVIIGACFSHYVQLIIIRQQIVTRSLWLIYTSASCVQSPYSLFKKIMLIRIKE